MYEFPLAANTKDLLTQMRNYFNDLKITEHDLKTPSSNFVIEFYKLFLTEFFIDPNAIMQMSGSQMIVLGEYSDMYNEIIPLINLTEAVKRFGIPALKNFCIYDLINPGQKRTFNHLANVMLFIRFADTRVEIIQPKLEKIKEMETRKQTILRNIDEMKQTYNARLMEIANKKIGVKDKDAEIEKLKAEIEEMQLELGRLRERVNSSKLQFDTLNAEQDEYVKEIQILDNDLVELNGKIKQLKNYDMSLDPSSEPLSIEILEKKVKESSESLKETREGLSSKQEHCEILEKSFNAHMARVGLLKEVKLLIENNIENKQKSNEIQKEIEKIAGRIEKMKASILLIEDELNHKHEKLMGLNLQWTKQKSSLKESLDIAKKEFAVQKEINLSKQSELDDIENLVEYYTKAIEENEECYNILIDKLEQKNELENKKEEETAQSMVDALRNAFQDHEKH